MEFLDRLNAPGKSINQLEIGDTFTETGLYNPTCTLVYKVEKVLDNLDLVVCRDQHGWAKCFEKDSVVFQIH